VENEKIASPDSSPSSHSTKTATGFDLPSWSKLALFIGLIALASIGYFSSGIFKKPTPLLTASQEADPEELTKRKILPDISLTEADGKQKKLADYHGNVVLLSFWASWCAPCLVELPTFAELEKRFLDHGLKVVAINVDEGDSARTFAKDFWAKKNFAFPSFFDPQKTVASQFEVDMLPSTFVIDRQGRIAFSGFGANDWSSPQTLEILESILSEKKPGN